MNNTEESELMDAEIEEDGPPPGWESIPKSEEQQPSNNDVDNDVDDEDQGPPPGWELNQYHQEEKKEGDDEEEEEDSLDDGPPPGWETMAKSESNEMEEDDEDPLDDGPPPGWEPILHQSPSISAAITPRSPILEPVLKQEVKSEDDDDDDDPVSDGPPPGWESVDPHRGLSVATPSPPVRKQEGKGDDDIAPPSKWQSERIPFTKKHMAPPLPQSLSTPAAPSSDSEMGQMVCGSCRQLLSHPLGERYVQCSCCLTVNFVLEEHQVGQVQCRSCSVLLMYPYGASSVRCSSCRCVTNIGAHNRRPLLSVQQGRGEPPIPNSVH
ncbi:cell surface glycoprotein 1-like [Impatiens glandulifera]|uniref:cell surface glycoprotein 1-like n=1 Tax=Impatiens glandulifera TaxID=253017 RepID=UPI001FB09187|nr:cell surface glycoprotein 1-like [Impatiens glandulifera]